MGKEDRLLVELQRLDQPPLPPSQASQCALELKNQTPQVVPLLPRATSSDFPSQLPTESLLLPSASVEPPKHSLLKSAACIFS